MFKKGVSYLVLSSFLLMDAASCMEPEESPPFSPPRSPRVLRNPPASSASPASSSSSPSDLDSQEMLQAISMLPWDEEGQKLRYKLLAEFALQEDTPMTLRREAFSSIYSTDSLDEVTRKSLEGLRVTFLNAEELPFNDRFTFLPNSDEEAAPVATLLSLTRALESVNDGSYEEWNVLRLIQLLMSYDRTETQEGIERCYFKQPGLFLDGGAYDEWLHTTLEMSNENKRASMLQKIREVMHSTEDVKKVGTAAKFILQYSQDAGDRETALETFFNIAAQQTASHSETPQEQFLRRKLDISDACKVLFPYVSEEKASLLRTMSEDMFQQVGEKISAIVDPQERLQAISALPWDQRSRVYAELALKEDIPMASRREAFSSIHSIYSLDEVTREGLRNLITALLNDEELIDPQEILTMVSMLPWDEGNRLYAKLALKEGIPMALRRKAFSSIHSIYSLDEVAREGLRNLTAAILNDEELIDPQEILKMISVLPWEEGYRLYAKLALKEGVPMALRRKAFSSIFSIDSLDEATREGLGKLIVTLLNDEELIDPQEILKMISRLPRDERNRPYAELALKEGIPMTLRQKAFSSIHSIYSLDEITSRRLGNLKAIFLSTEELPLQERLKFFPNANEAVPSITTLLSLTQALESADEESYNESDIRSLISFLMRCDKSESQIGIERCYFKQPRLFLDDGVWKEWFRTLLETGDESKRVSILQRLREVLHSTEDGKKFTAAKFILQYSQNLEDKDTALEIFVNSVQELITRISEIPQESFLKEKSNIGGTCTLFMPYAPEDKVHLLRALSDDMFQQVRAEISEIINPQERLQAINNVNGLIRYTLLADLALQESMPKDIRRAALLYIDSTDFLDEITREKLKSLRPAFLNDEELPLAKRLAFLPSPEEEAPPVATLLSLMHALEAEESNSLDLDDEAGYKYVLYRFLAECPAPEVQQRLKNYYFNHPIVTVLYLKEWLNDFYKKSEESQKTLILQKMQGEMQQTTDLTFGTIAAAKFFLKHGQDHEPTIQALWKLVEKQASNDSEESEEEGEQNYEGYEKKDRLIMVCEILLKYAPTSPVRESVLSRLFTETEEELFPRALVLLLTQEEPSINVRARELGEQRLDQNNLDYTLGLFFNLEDENVEQDLRYKIQENLKAIFNDSADKEVLLRLALAFLRATDENLSQKAFDHLKQVLIDNYNDLEDPEIVIYQIIGAVGADHPWAQEVINIGIGIEQIDHPYSAIGVYHQLLKKVKEPVIHHPSSTRLDDGRVVTFNIETLRAPRSLSNLLPVQHSEFMALVEGLHKEVRKNQAAKAEFSTISKNISAKALVNKANEPYFKNLLDSEAGQGVISLISFKLRRLITDIIALKEKTQTVTEPSLSSSSMVIGPSTAPSKSELSPASKAIAQLLINVMQCNTNKDDGIDNTYRLLGYEKVISEKGMREERLITTAQEHIMEDLRQIREGLLNGEGPVVKELLFGPKENHDRKIDEPPHQGKYLSNLLGGELGSFLEGQSVSYDLHGGCIEEKLRSYTRQQVLDTLHRHFKPEKVIERYHDQFNIKGGKGRPTNLISTLMGEEMMKDTPEGKKEVNDKYSTFDSETWEFKEYKPLLVAEILLRLNILREVQPPSITIGVPSSSSSIPLPSSSTLPNEDSVKGP